MGATTLYMSQSTRLGCRKIHYKKFNFPKSVFQTGYLYILKITIIIDALCIIILGKLFF